MRLAIILSVLLHVGVILWILGPFTSSRTFNKPEAKPVAVGMISASEFSAMKKGLASAKKSENKGGLAKKKTQKAPAPKAKKVAPKVKKAKKPKAVLPPKPAEKTQPKKVKKKVVKKVAKPKPKPKPKKKIAKAKPKPKKAKPVKKKIKKTKTVRKQVKKRANKSKPKRFDPENIAALLNKLPDQQDDPSPIEKWKKETAPKKMAKRFDDEAVYGRRSGRDAKITANEIDAFKAQISQCWSPPAGGAGLENVVIKLRLSFKRGGDLANPPRLMNHSSSPVFQAIADSAIRAVWQCKPYRLPDRKFETWREMVLNFDPREMYGGY